jgi:alkylation response protein AidB-like acyl-CoA dehydrogenase
VRLRGRAEFVPDAPGADDLLLLARDADGTPVVVRVDRDTPGVEVVEQPLVDATRSMGVVTADGPIEPSSVWRFAGDPSAAEAAARHVVDRGAVALACDSLGLSRAMLDATVDYARVREQFARPIGSFQAVKHACADLLVQITASAELVAAAVTAVAHPDADASVAASMAKAHAGETGVAVAGGALQLHGGIGYTWESGIHVYLKRAALNRSLLGSPAAHRHALAARLVTEHH